MSPNRIRLYAAALLGMLAIGGGTLIIQPWGTKSAAEQASEVAQTHAERFAAGDYAGAWELLSADAQRAISRADYVRLATECPSKYTSTLPFTAKSVRLDGANRAAYTAQRGELGYSLDLVFEDGHWRVNPPPHMWLDYAQGVDALLAKRHADGNC